MQVENTNRPLLSGPIMCFKAGILLGSVHLEFVIEVGEVCMSVMYRPVYLY